MADQLSAQLEPWYNLQNKVVLVTGASSGLGRDFCLNLAKAGCRIVAAARRVDRLKSLCQEINQLPSLSSPNDRPNSARRAIAVELDVCADGATIDRCVQMAWEAFGGIDALVNNAGVRGILDRCVFFCSNFSELTILFGFRENCTQKFDTEYQFFVLENHEGCQVDPQLSSLALLFPKYA